MRVMATSRLALPGPRRSTGDTLRSLAPYLWPKGDPGARVRVVVAMLFLVASKMATVYVPILYSRAVDALSRHGGAAQVLAVPVGLIVGYGLIRLASAGFGEMRDAVFAAVQQRTVRRVALQTFEHMHRLSLRFHLDRQTGGVSRAIERGSAGIESVLRLAVFNIVPTMIELLLVTAVLWRLFDWRFALVTFAAVGAYIGFTISFATWRVRFRRSMNDNDTEAQAKAVDSLLNYETVKYFGNEAHEANRFDRALAAYERAAVKSQVTLNMLNLGQAAIIAAGLAAIMLLAARGVVSGQMSVGKFVLANTYLIQLYQPLNFLGFAYNTIKQGLVDMEQMFRLLSVSEEVQDSPDALPLTAHLSEDKPCSVTCASAISLSAKSSKGCLSPFRPGGKLPLSARRVRANPPSPACCSVSTMSAAGKSWSMAAMCATTRRRACVRRSAWCRRTRCCSTTPYATTSPTEGRAPARTRWNMRRASHRCMISSCACRTATTRASASAA
jgi:ATP-binding cassette subfamily B protein